MEVKLTKKEIYIYNLEQAQFFLESGLLPMEINCHSTTKMVYFKFARDEKLEAVLKKWRERRR